MCIQGIKGTHCVTMDHTLPIGSTANAISSANCLTKRRALIGDVPVLFVFDLFNKLKGLAFNCIFSIYAYVTRPVKINPVST